MVPIINVGTGVCAEEKDFWVLRQKTTIIHTSHGHHIIRDASQHSGISFSSVNSILS